MSDKAHEPYVPAQSTMSEFTWRALLLGLVMAVVLGAANAYLGLKSGLTISTSIPVAVLTVAFFKALGAAGVIEVGNNVQAVFGTQAEALKNEIKDVL